MQPFVAVVPNDNPVLLCRQAAASVVTYSPLHGQ